MCVCVCVCLGEDGPYLVRSGGGEGQCLKPGLSVNHCTCVVSLWGVQHISPCVRGFESPCLDACVSRCVINHWLSPLAASRQLSERRDTLPLAPNCPSLATLARTEMQPHKTKLSVLLAGQHEEFPQIE